MKPRSTIKTDLFAFDPHRKKIDSLGDPLAEIESYIDFAALAAEEGASPRVRLEATNVAALRHCALEDLQAHAAQ